MFTKKGLHVILINVSYVNPYINYNLRGHYLLEGHRNSHNYEKSHKKMRRPLFIDDPLRLGEKIEVSGLCPSCHSIYVTKGQCESCGLQFGLDVVGEPFGSRSFFTLKDDFDSSLTKWNYIEWRLSSEVFLKKPQVKRYIRHMLKRFEDLVSYFAGLDFIEVPEDTDGSENHIRLFMFEAREIMKEYQRFSTDLSALFITLKKFAPEVGDADAISEELLVDLHGLERFSKESSIGTSIELKSSLWDMLKSGIVLEAMAAIGAITLASFLVMKYLSS